MQGESQVMASPLLAMASGGGDEARKRAEASALNRRTWANVVKPRELASMDQPASINQKKNLEKLKKSVSDVVLVDKEMKNHATNRMANSLFGKFLGKAPLPRWRWSRSP